MANETRERRADDDAVATKSRKREKVKSLNVDGRKKKTQQRLNRNFSFFSGEIALCMAIKKDFHSFHYYINIMPNNRWGCQGNGDGRRRRLAFVDTQAADKSVKRTQCRVLGSYYSFI